MATKPSSKSRALVPWQEEMAALAKRQAKAEKLRGAFPSISTRGGILSIDDDPIEGGELSVVVLQAIHENQYYTRAFDPNNPASPDCYAFGNPDEEEPEGQMAPHEESADKQGDDNGLCANCWANQMGSADVGRGKACKNVRRLAVVTSDALESAQALEDAEVRMLKLPVMSVQGWSKNVHKLAEEMGLPFWGAVFTLKCVPDAKSQFRVQLTFEEKIEFNAELYEMMKAKIAEVTPSMMTPYPPPQAEEERPQRGRRAAPARPAPRAPAPAPKATKAPGKPVKTPVRPAKPAPAREESAAPAPPAKKAAPAAPARKGFQVPVKTAAPAAGKRAPKY